MEYPLKSKIIYAIVFILVAFSLYLSFFSAPSNFPEGTAINIKENSSLRSISRSLAENHVIRSRVVFETLVIIYGGDKNIKFGDYLFEKKLSVFEIARRVAKGERNISPIKITIPEGLNVEEISETIAKKIKSFDQIKFKSLAQSKEGYLFPDTYFFFSDDKEEYILKVLNDNYEKKITSVRPQINGSGRSEKEIITMASILEKESKGDIDREMISGILWKRLSLGMPLQVDAAPETYKTKGLPKDPIANPGMEAIMAAIKPKSSNYLYYLHDKDGGVHYARTFAEHLLNKKKYLR